MTRKSIGELEEQVLLALLHLGSESYAVPIVEELHARAGRRVSPATVYMVLRRLEDRGLLSSRVGEAAPERGGRPKRYFRIRKKAMPLLQESRRVLTALWKGLEPELGPPS